MSTSKTPNLNLPQYTKTDKFNMEEINSGYLEIDKSYKEIKDSYDSAIEESTINGSIDNLEVISARKGEIHLKAKIDKIDASLEDIVQEYNDKFNVVEIKKATKQELDIERKRVDEISIKGTTSDVIKNATKEQIDKYITDGTISNMTIIDDSIELNKVKFVNLYKGNRLNINEVKFGGHYNATTLEWVVNQDFCQSEFIHCKAGDTIRVKTVANTGYHMIVKNKDGIVYGGVVVNSINGVVTHPLPSNSQAVMFSIMLPKSQLTNCMIYINDNIPTEYTSFDYDGNSDGQIKIGNRNILNNTILKDKVSFKTIGDYSTHRNNDVINFLDTSKCKLGGFYNSSTLLWQVSLSEASSDFIPCKAGDTIRFKVMTNGSYHVVFKDKSGNIYSGQAVNITNLIGTITLSSISNAVEFAIQLKGKFDNYMITVNKDIPLTFIPYNDYVAFNNDFIRGIDVSLNNIKNKDVDIPYIDGRVLVWEDNFNYKSLDTTHNWNYLYRGDGNGNNQLEFNTDREKNVRIEDNKLIITAIKENFRGKAWTSAQINTHMKHEFLYGRIETRCKIPKAKGMWSAFWTLGSDLGVVTQGDGTIINFGQGHPQCGELDIFESWGASDTVHSAIHYADNNGGLISSSGGAKSILKSDFHIYAIEWTENLIEFFVDDVKIGEFDVNNATTNTGYNPFRNPQYLILNLAVDSSSNNTPDITTPLTNEMIVDWVRVYAPTSTPNYTNINSISFNKSEITVNLSDNKTKLINYTILPVNSSDKCVVWKSSNSEVVECRGGYITPKSIGITTITGTTINYKKATCVVNVI